MCSFPVSLSPHLPLPFVLAVAYEAARINVDRSAWLEKAERKLYLKRRTYSNARPDRSLTEIWLVMCMVCTGRFRISVMAMADLVVLNDSHVQWHQRLTLGQSNDADCVGRHHCVSPQH